MGMKKSNFDFGGYATRFDVKCTDGRTIRKGSFEHMDGMEVPMVWGHDHSNPSNVIGKCLLEARPDGMYTYGTFNDTARAQDAKKAVMHGDLNRLSIYANHIKETNNDVLHGEIREVSIVYAGANDGAFIDVVSFAHDDDNTISEAILFSGDDIEIMHEYKEGDEGKMTDNKERTIEDVLKTLNEEQIAVLNFLNAKAYEEGAKSKDKADDDDEVAQADNDDDYISHSEGEDNMKWNAFDQTGDNTNTIAHADELMSEKKEIYADAERCGSLKKSFIAHAAAYGIDNIDIFFEEAKAAGEPYVIDRKQDWVTKFMGGTKKLPWGNIKSEVFDITADEARAKGYVKGTRKVEEVITVAKRETNVCTIYKKQRFDRDDVIDADFPVYNFIKKEMRGKLDEEVARAGLVGDGRAADASDKIPENKIRPIYSDDDLYSLKYYLPVTESDTDETKANAFIEAVIRNRKDYRGVGNPICFTTEDMIASLQLLKDKNGRYIYESMDALCKRLRVSEIVPVPVMENITGEQTEGQGAQAVKYDTELVAILVNPSDYAYGSRQGGQVSFFEDFDIDFNQQKFLLETRLSGCLTKPYSAQVFNWKKPQAAG